MGENPRYVVRYPTAPEGLNPFLAPPELYEGDIGLWKFSPNLPPVAPPGVDIQIQAFTFGELVNPVQA